MNMRYLMFSLLLPSVIASAKSESGSSPSVIFAGAFQNPVTFDRAQLATLPREQVEGDDHGTKGSWNGVRMLELLRKAGAPMDLAKVVLVTAADGYRVAFALAEFDPAFGNSTAILADTRDSKPLDEKEGPFRLVIADEQRAGRWVRQVVRVELIDVMADTSEVNATRSPEKAQ